MSGDDKKSKEKTGEKKHLFDRYAVEEDPVKPEDIEYDEYGRAVKKITPEDTYFQERDHEYIEEKRHELEQKRIEEEKKLCYMKCPKCGIKLDIVKFKRISIDRCSQCEGIWIDKGDLATMHQKGPILMTALVAKFFGEPHIIKQD